MDEEIFPLNEAANREKTFLLGMAGIGVRDCDEQAQLLQIAKQCASSKGLEKGIAGAAIGGGLGVEIAGIGAVPGAVVGALVGLYQGTNSCMDAQTTQEVRIFAVTLCNL